MKKQLSTYPLRLPTSLKTAVAELSRADGTSINQFVTTAVAEKVSALRTADFFAGRAAQADIEKARRLLRRSGGQVPAPEDRLQTADEGREGAVPIPEGAEEDPDVIPFTTTVGDTLVARYGNCDAITTLGRGITWGVRSWQPAVVARSSSGCG